VVACERSGGLSREKVVRYACRLLTETMRHSLQDGRPVGVGWAAFEKVQKKDVTTKAVNTEMLRNITLIPLKV
jgi:hypothetical protein